MSFNMYIEHLSISLLSYVKCFLNSFNYIYLSIFSFLLLSCSSSIYILYTWLIFCQIYVLLIFTLYSLFVHFLKSSLMREVFVVEIQFRIFLLYIGYLFLLLKKHCQLQLWRYFVSFCKLFCFSIHVVIHLKLFYIY